MPTIKFATGQQVKFDGNPTPQDVEEVSRKLGIGSQNKVQFQEQSPETMNVGSVFGKPVVGGVTGSLIKDPVGTLKTIGRGIASSEVNTGEDVSAAINENRPDVQSAQGKAQDARTQANEMFSKLLAKSHELALAGKDTHNLDSVISDEAKTLGIANFEDIIPNAANKSKGQILGDFAGVALDAATAGSFAPEAKTGELLTKADRLAEAARVAEGATDAEKALTTGEKLASVAKKGAAAAAKGAAIGYGYDVSQNLQQDKKGGDALTPGMGTLVGASIPAAFSLYNAGKITAQALGPRIDNSLIKPLPKQFRYGANPGRTMAEMGVTGNSWDDLVQNITTAKQTTGRQLSALGSQLQERSAGSTLDLSKNLAPLDKAMEEAAANNDSTLLQRLQNVKTAITDHLAPKIGDEGAIVGIESKGQRNLKAATFQDSLDIKRTIGGLTKWTGNASDDKAVNMALKRVYGGVNASTKALADGVDSDLAAQFEKANKRYADLQTAEIATKHRLELSQSKNLVSMPIKVGAITGIVTAVATGGAAIPAMLATAAAAGLDKALETPAVKTRLAKWMASASESTLTKIYAQNPGIRTVLIKLATGGTDDEPSNK